MLDIGLYGRNGHQLNNEAHYGGKVRIAAYCGLTKEMIPPSMLAEDAVCYETLRDMAGDKRIRMVSLCSPMRQTQAGDAVMVMEAGKHVLCEKPCAFSERDIDRLTDTAARRGVIFREMCETAYEQPYRTLRHIVMSGEIGEVAEVFAQKSYPMHPGRPQDDDTDGGIIRWVGVHGLRLIEHITGIPIADIDARRTGLGNPVSGGGLHPAAVLSFTLNNGAVGSAILNYLNPTGFGSWGNEHIRIFGTRGMAEITDGGKRRRLVVGDRDMGEFPLQDEDFDYFDALIGMYEGRSRLPLSLEEELHPTRMVIRAHDTLAAKNANK